MVKLIFKPTVGVRRDQIPVVVGTDVLFKEVVRDVIKKLGLPLEETSIQSEEKHRGMLDDLLSETVGEVVAKYGTNFRILPRTIVGTDEDVFDTGIERHFPEMPKEVSRITPRDRDWYDRVKVELAFMVRYKNLLMKRFKAPMWFQLVPRARDGDNYQKWKGFIKVPEEPTLEFDLRVVLGSEYPKVMPRAFLDDRICGLTSKFYRKPTFEEDGKVFYPICHDHMKELKRAWKPTYGIAHFFSREIYIWWVSELNCIVSEWRKRQRGENSG